MINRRDFLASSATIAGAWLARHPRLAPQAPLPRPSAPQLSWQRDELAMFLHFGVNTYTDREWGDGREDPAIFAPAQLDARQWARAARRGGFRAMILTAKHHDGFCLWPTATTQHASKRDVVREFVDACRAEGLRAGLYLSPWDRNNPAYGDSPRYNDLYCDQLTELLTRYGAIFEVWFDGANGEGPNGKRQVYDWPRVWALVRKLQPDAVMFSDAGPDVRWCGNEKGFGGDPNWATVDPSIVTYPGMDAPGVTAALQHGAPPPAGTVWRPAEADTSIRPGWFYHPAEDERVRAVDNLVDLYFNSVGRNAKLLLNVPPTRDGLLHPTDVSRLAGFRDRLTTLFATNVAAEGRSTWRANTLEVELSAPAKIGIVRLAEDIALGQSVARYTVEASDGGPWRTLASGTTIGYARLDRFEPVSVRKLRVVVTESVAPPQPLTLAAYAGA